jgi:hypothetical protein
MQINQCRMREQRRNGSARPSRQRPGRMRLQLSKKLLINLFFKSSLSIPMTDRTPKTGMILWSLNLASKKNLLPLLLVVSSEAIDNHHSKIEQNLSLLCFTFVEPDPTTMSNIITFPPASFGGIAFLHFFSILTQLGSPQSCKTH